MKYCIKCGNNLQGKNFCTKCGYRIVQIEDSYKNKSDITTNTSTKKVKIKKYSVLFWSSWVAFFVLGIILCSVSIVNFNDFLNRAESSNYSIINYIIFYSNILFTTVGSSIIFLFRDKNIKYFLLIFSSIISFIINTVLLLSNIVFKLTSIMFFKIIYKAITITLGNELVIVFAVLSGLSLILWIAMLAVKRKENESK